MSLGLDVFREEDDQLEMKVIITLLIAQLIAVVLCAPVCKFYLA